jgi:hypothetical protein
VGRRDQLGEKKLAAAKVGLIESPLRGSTARFICNPIVDDVEADPDPEEAYYRKIALPPSVLQ